MSGAPSKCLLWFNGQNFDHCTCYEALGVNHNIPHTSLKNTLAKAGGTVDDIVSMSVFITDLRLVPQFNKLTKELFKKGYPAVTFIEVSHLARPQSLIEIQPIAVIP